MIAPAGVVHGLRTTGKVDDGQAAVPQADAFMGPDALSVGTAVTHGCAHGLHLCRTAGGQGSTVQMADARYAAHVFFQSV